MSWPWFYKDEWKIFVNVYYVRNIAIILQIHSLNYSYFTIPTARRTFITKYQICSISIRLNKIFNSVIDQEFWHYMKDYCRTILSIYQVKLFIKKFWTSVYYLKRSFLNGLNIISSWGVYSVNVIKPWIFLNIRLPMLLY